MFHILFDRLEPRFRPRSLLCFALFGRLNNLRRANWRQLCGFSLRELETLADLIFDGEQSFLTSKGFRCTWLEGLVIFLLYWKSCTTIYFVQVYINRSAGGISEIIRFVANSIASSELRLSRSKSSKHICPSSRLKSVDLSLCFEELTCPL